MYAAASGPLYVHQKGATINTAGVMDFIEYTYWLIFSVI